MIQAPVTTPVTVPDLGDAVSEVTIIRWLKAPGDAVTVGEPLLEVATDKVDTEIAAVSAGVLVEVLYAENCVVPVGDVIARVAVCAPPDDRAVEAISGEPASSVETPTELPAAARVEQLPRIRRTIARRMLDSLLTSAQLTTVVEVDVTRVVAERADARADFEQRTGRKLTVLPYIVAAAVGALEEHPILNASVDADCTQVTYHPAVHLGVAVDSERGLMVPVIRNADCLTVEKLALAIADHADAVRSHTIGPDDLVGGTFTITNTGSRGSLFDTPIINQPQSAILGIGAIVERVVPTREPHGLLMGIRSMAHFSLTYDHRIVDGADAARYLTSIRERLTEGSNVCSGKP